MTANKSFLSCMDSLLREGKAGSASPVRCGCCGILPRKHLGTSFQLTVKEVRAMPATALTPNLHPSIESDRCRAMSWPSVAMPGRCIGAIYDCSLPHVHVRQAEDSSQQIAR